MTASLLAGLLVTVFGPSAAVAAKPGGSAEVVLRLAVEPGYHINASKPTERYMIPTRLAWTAPPGWKHLGDTFPAPLLKAFGFAPEKKLAVYEGVPTVKARFSVPASARGRHTLEGKLRYQACDDKACYPPETAAFKVVIEVGEEQKQR